MKNSDRNKHPGSATQLLPTVDSQLPTSATGKNLVKNGVDFQVIKKKLECSPGVLSINIVLMPIRIGMRLTIFDAGPDLPFYLAKWPAVDQFLVYISGLQQDFKSIV
jgi:hypothetical protein